MATTLVNRLVAAAVPLIVIPIALEEMGVAAFGAWSAAVSVSAFAAFGDLGLGTGLMTRLAECFDAGELVDEARARALVASCYVLLAGVVTFLIALLLAAFSSGQLASLVGSGGGTAQVPIDTIVVVTLGAFILNIIASLIFRVQYAAGQQVQANLWQAAGTAATLVAAWLASALGGGVDWFLIGVAFAPVAVAGANTCWFFTRNQTGSRIRPSLLDCDRAVAQDLLQIGLRFLVISTFMAASLGLDPWIVSHIGTLDEVAEYSIPFRVLTMVGTIGAMLALPLWPLHAGAIARGEVDWIRSVTRRMMAASLALVAPVAVGVLLMREQLVASWLDAPIATPFVAWAGLGVWALVQAAASPMFMVQNGAGVLKPQMLGYGALLIIGIPLKWNVGANIGIEWIPWVGSLTYIVFVWPAAWIGYSRSMRKAAPVELIK